MADIVPDTFMVRILGSGGLPVGVGALVTERHIVTCAHVVNIALGLDARSQGQPVDVVSVDFPLTQTGGMDVLPNLATVVRWLPPPREGATGDDIAGLELLADHAPAGTTAAQLAVDIPRPGRTVRVFGYPGTPPRLDGAWVSTTVRGRVGGSRLQLDSGPDSALRVQPGFSGSPVFDDAIGRVVGLLAAAPAGRDLERDSYAISANHLRFAWPEILDTRRQPIIGSAQDRRATGLTVLHISDTQFGKHHLFGGNGLTSSDRAEDTLFRRLHHDLSSLADDRGLRPDLMIVTGDLVEQGLRSEFEQAIEFLGALSEAAGIPRRHVAIVPGNHDVNRKASQAYFNEQESDEAEAVPPYFPKWRQFVSAFNEFYCDVDGVTFTPDEPWTLFEMTDLAVVVAGLNSTIAESHRDGDHYGLLGEHQLQWFADRLTSYRRKGWLRLAAVHHNVVRGAALDEENLRDADDLDRLIGEPGLANLLLHGHTHDAKLNLLSSGLPVLSSGSAAVEPSAWQTEIPNQYQLITIRNSDFTRYARQYSVGQRRWIGDNRISPSGSDWRDHRKQKLVDVSAVFPSLAESTDEEIEANGRQYAGGRKHAGARKTRGDNRRPNGQRAALAGTERETDKPDMRDSWQADRISDSDERFLARVAEATRARFPEASVTERPEASYLRASRLLPSGGMEQWPVGVIEGPATEATVETFVTNVHRLFASADFSVQSELVYGGPAAPGQLVAWARKHGVRLRSFIEYQGLIDLRPLAEKQSERLATDRIYPAWLYVPQRYRMVSGGNDDDNVLTGLIDQAVTWLSVDEARLVIVLGDFGRGKTSFLRQLTRMLPTELPGVLPILVELRTLEKAPALDELLTQYLVRQGVEDINPAKLRYMIHSGRIALLFDGFDELELRVGYDNAAEYLRVLLDSVTGRSKVVLTSRTQHFRSTEQVRTALGERVEALTASRVVVLEDFSEEQILQFLTNLYHGDDARARVRFELLADIANLLDLAHNPRMLAFVAALDEDRLRAVQSEGRISAGGLYKEIIDYWLASEAARQEHRRGLSSIDEDERLAACTALAQRLWASKNLTIGLSDLSAEVSATLTGLAERGYSSDQATHSIGSGSLLVRTDDGAFTFVHQSIMEWLVAAAAARDLDDPRTREILTTGQMSRLMADFFVDLSDHLRARDWATRTLADPGASQVAKQNALAISDRLGIAPGQGQAANLGERQNLAGVDLRAQDLTNHDLSGADLSRANLRGMRLRGTNLSEVDLRDADLTGVRFIEGSLLGAMLNGSKWDRAALVGTTGLDEIADSSEQLRVAAVAGRDPAEVMIQPSKDASCVAFSPDGTLLAIGSGAAIEIVDAADGRIVRILHGHTGSVRGVVFSPDGTSLATIAADRTARVWDLDTCTTRIILQGHTDYIRDAVFSPDSNLLATASYDKTIRLWDLKAGTGRVIRRHTSPAQSLVFTKDGILLAATSEGRVTRIWNSDADTIRITLGGHADIVRDAAFSADGTLLATTADDRTTRICDLATGTIRTILQGHATPAQSVMFSADGSLLATAAADGTIRIWDLATGATRTTLQGHTSSVREAAFSPDGAVVATTVADGTVRIWDLTTDATRTLLQGHTNWVQSIAFSPDGALLATACDDGVSRIWDLATGTARTTNAVLDDHRNWVQTVAFSTGGALLATAFDGRTARIWDLMAGTPGTTLKGDTGSMPNAAFSPDGTMLATASYDNTVRLWDLETGTSNVTLEGHTGSVRDVVFSPDGMLLATASADETARLWDLENGTLIAVLEGHTSWVQGVEFSPDGNSLATVSDDKTARVWELTWLRREWQQAKRDGNRWVVYYARVFATLKGHTGGVRDAAFSPDGALVATASDDGTVRIWNLATNGIRTTLQGHTASVRHIAFSPDGTLLATASYDNTTRIWDVISGACIVTLVSLSRGGYATLVADGYKLSGDPGNDLWWAIKLCRFAPGELDPYVAGLKRLPEDSLVLDLSLRNTACKA